MVDTVSIYRHLFFFFKTLYHSLQSAILGPALISLLDNNRVPFLKKWLSVLGTPLLFSRGTCDETAAEGDLVPCLLQTLCPRV